MTNTKAIGKLLADGVPRTAKQIAEEVGISHVKVRSAIHELSGNGRMVINRSVRPGLYSLTQLGMEFAADRPVTEQAALERKRIEMARRRQLERERSNYTGTNVIQHALQSRPVLQSIWGSAHA